MLSSLKKRHHPLEYAANQVEWLSKEDGLSTFESKLELLGQTPLKPHSVSILQINVGKMCNQVCTHCHVDAGPDRKEIMTKETMLDCLEAVKKGNFETVDLTGGAPEMNPNFRWFVEQLSSHGLNIIVRCNLTIILANPKYNDLPQFFKKHRVNVVSSLPYFNARRTDAQRGEGVFEKSIKALKMLNEVGYGVGDKELQLDLVYNPAGAFLPDDQSSLEAQFREKLDNEYNVFFDHLFAITNLPISRFLEYLTEKELYEEYMQELITAFNEQAVESVMCRSMISVGWDGLMYDCDFNQMLDLKVNVDVQHISEFNQEVLLQRDIIINRHCFGCTAGAGSSCGGTVA